MLSSAFVLMPLHYVVVTKERLVEVLAQDVELLRVYGSTRDAAPLSLSS
jgi:hypothetical protein